MPEPETLRVAEQYYIVADAERSTTPLRVMKHGDSFGVFDQYGDIVPLEGSDQGFYHKGTRFLSRLELLIGARRPLFLSSTISEEEKSAFLGGARALLFPIDWPEPFGLVQIESLACGTPVVAFRGGSVAEVLDEGVTGCVVESLDEAIEAVRNIDRVDRRMCRLAFEARFSSTRMALDYVGLYQQLSATSLATNLVA